MENELEVVFGLAIAIELKVKIEATTPPVSHGTD